MTTKRPLSRCEASLYLLEKYGIKQAVGTLARKAVMGGGPRFRRGGRFPIYSVDELDLWAEKYLSKCVGTTSELANVRRTRA